MRRVPIQGDGIAIQQQEKIWEGFASASNFTGTNFILDAQIIINSVGRSLARIERTSALWTRESLFLQ
jgi:hypothetical protein